MLNKIFDRFRSNDKKDYAQTYTIRSLINDENALDSLGARLGIPLPEYSMVIEKQSDVLFVLGSGPSINTITDEQWGNIKEHDSVGFNFWMLHDFIPSFYALQFPVGATYVQLMREVLDYRQPKYYDVPILIRGGGLGLGACNITDKELNSLSKFKLGKLLEFSINSKLSLDPNETLEFLDKIGLMRFGSPEKYVPKLRSSLTMLISLGYQMGYKEIVLCGFDMNDGVTHFWDENHYDKLVTRFELNRIKETSKDFSHHTSKEYSKVTVPDYVYAMNNYFLNKGSVRISLINKDSVLYPALPIYNL